LSIQLCLRNLQLGCLRGKAASIAYIILLRIYMIDVLATTGDASKKNRCIKTRRLRAPRENLAMDLRVSIRQDRISWHKHWEHGQCQPGHSMYGDAFMLTKKKKRECARCKEAWVSFIKLRLVRRVDLFYLSLFLLAKKINLLCTEYEHGKLSHLTHLAICKRAEN
jgi:hypothetical protein